MLKILLVALLYVPYHDVTAALAPLNGCSLIAKRSIVKQALAVSEKAMQGEESYIYIAEYLSQYRDQMKPSDVATFRKVLDFEIDLNDPVMAQHQALLEKINNSYGSPIMHRIFRQWVEYDLRNDKESLPFAVNSEREMRATDTYKPKVRWYMKFLAKIFRRRNTTPIEYLSADYYGRTLLSVKQEKRMEKLRSEIDRLPDLAENEVLTIVASFAFHHQAAAYKLLEPKMIVRLRHLPILMYIHQLTELDPGLARSIMEQANIFITFNNFHSFLLLNAGTHFDYVDKFGEWADVVTWQFRIADVIKDFDPLLTIDLSTANALTGLLYGQIDRNQNNTAFIDAVRAFEPYMEAAEFQSLSKQEDI